MGYNGPDVRLCERLYEPHRSSPYLGTRSAVGYTLADKHSSIKNLLDMAMLALNHVQGDPLNPTAREDLVKYLINCETWTHYEIMIFYNFIFIFDVETVIVIQ